jgi:hypothetical protein
MVNYNNGKIYKIISASTNSIYIGSTTKEYLSQRISEHRARYKLYSNGANGVGYCAAMAIIKYKDHQIVLVESVPCKSKDELHAREQHHIDQNKDIVVNLYKAKHGFNNKKDYYRAYHANHKAEKAVTNKQWDQRNANRYFCPSCEYSTSKKGHFAIHMQSKKHQREWAEYVFDVEMDRLADISVFDE